MRNFLVFIIVGIFTGQSCTENIEENIQQVQTSAKVTAVECKGQSLNYTFDVTIESPDLGCNQYADWWEVITADSVLIYRRILAHSHVDEQPFTRSGGIVNVAADEFIYIRAHMNNLGYGFQVYSGTPRDGLVIDTLDISFGISLEFAEPLPTDCAF